MHSENPTKITPRIYRREEHSISRKNIDADALKIMRRLMRHGYKAYLVGGGVRDLLLGKKPKDFDIATDATPRRVKALFRNCRIIGRRFKLAHIYFGNGKIFEVSTFRAGQEAESEPSGDKDSGDSTSDDRESGEKDLLITHDNIYGDEESDALRRDVTINALFYALRNFSVIDYVGGMDDLRAGIVRVIGDPDVRFAEDPVRMMRVVRHAARAGFAIEPGCREALLRSHASILNCSEVRLFEEIKKDLSSGFAAEILQQLSEHRLLQHLLPELTQHDAELLFRRSFFGRCLKRVDALALEEGIDTLTPVFALIALFTGVEHADDHDLAGRFSSPEEIEDFVASCFSKLAVPRRERERVVQTLMLWHTLETVPAERLSARKVMKDPAFNDVQTLLRFLNVDRRAQAALDAVEELLSAPRETKSHNSRGRGGRAHRPITL